MFATSTLLSLALLGSAAEATYTPKIKNIRIRQTTDTSSYRSVAVTTAEDVAALDGSLDGVSLELAEADAWLHGAAPFGAAPDDGATFELLLYDTGSAHLATFAGSAEDGVLRFSRADGGGGDGDCRACAREGTADDLDLEVLAARLHDDGELALDLAGADTLRVAYGKLSVTTSTAESVCVAWDGKECLKWETATTEATTRVEVAWEEVGIVWESDAVELAEGASLRLTATDATGKKADKSKLDLAAPWRDGAGGAHALPLDEDPLTTAAVTPVCHRWNAYDGTCQEESDGFVVLSDGWTLGDALPAQAAVEIDGGETWTVPAHSYQVSAIVPLGAVDLEAVAEVLLDGAALALSAASSKERIRRRWFSLTAMVEVGVDDDGLAWASATTWSADPDALPGSATLSVDGAEAEVAYTDEVAVVFALETGLAGDPHGLDLSGSVELQGEADKKGKRKTLARGGFAGQFGTDGDGDPDLASIDNGGATASRGDILIGGEPIGIEREVGDEGDPSLPPVVVAIEQGTGGGWVRVNKKPGEIIR
jgi:hypothetical protein